ncbi:MAG: hypothetical protein HQL21_08440 [Candidatus Omnitrophica bacterium]|nr:hypothetical protein [Candidatus Omnitrophota bacterium]
MVGFFVAQLNKLSTDGGKSKAFRQQAAIQKAKALEIEKIKKLELEAVSWQRSKILRSYVSAKKDKFVERHGQAYVGSELEKWVNWATQYAENLDPLSDRATQSAP